MSTQSAKGVPAQPETAVVVTDSVDARVAPRGSLENLSQAEIEKLLDTSQTGLYQLFRNCALAVLNSGSDEDNAKAIFERYS
ncbi:pyrimidine/purine nucleosidase domain-containing protein, partial [Staphylococcus aureus]